MKINVTLKDILNGKRRMPCQCPVSLALQKVFDTNVSVGATYFRIADDKDEYVLPYRVQEFISAFDNKEYFNRSILPFSFELNLPEESK